MRALCSLSVCVCIPLCCLLVPCCGQSAKTPRGCKMGGVVSDVMCNCEDEEGNGFKIGTDSRWMYQFVPFFLFPGSPFHPHPLPIPTSPPPSIDSARSLPLPSPLPSRTLASPSITSFHLRHCSTHSPIRSSSLHFLPLGMTLLNKEDNS